VISPVLANLALDGLEHALRRRYPQSNARGRAARVNLVRYADDFIITGRTKDLLEAEVRPIVQAFLAERRLELSEEKTRIVHIEDGFDFLVVAVRGTTGAVISDHALAAGPVPSWRAFRGYYLALSNDRKSVYALVLTQPPARDYLAVINVATTRVERRFAVASGIVFRSLAVGPVSGHIYLFGNRSGAVVVIVVDPRTGATLTVWTVRRSLGLHWVIYRGEVWNDERELFINYWRGEGIGIDAVSLPSGRLRGCRTVQVGCFRPGGQNIEQFDGRLISTSMTIPNVFVELNTGGRLLETLRIHMTGDLHTGDWDIDRALGRLYQVGSCSYTGGLAVLDLKTGRSGMLAPPGTPGAGARVTGNNDRTICGERISAGSQSLVVVGKTEYVYPVLQHQAVLLIMNGLTGTVLHRIRTSSDPMDLVVT
jgi:Reverse transcriptase (RNA-dependent DNA polymerase)